MNPKSAATGALPPAAAIGIGTGATVTAFFGSVWLGWGFSSLPNFSVPEWIAYDIVTLILLVAAIVTVRQGRATVGARSSGPSRFSADASKRFMIVAILEGLGCGMVVALTLGLHRSDLLAFGISLVVGIHFLPLANIFRYPAYFATGTAMVVCDLAAVVMFKGDGITAAVGIASGAVLWITTIALLVRARSVLTSQDHAIDNFK
jgi:hypothetical protein